MSNSVTYQVCFRWNYVPFDRESADYYGSMGDFRRFDRAMDAAMMLSRKLGNEWTVWVNKVTDRTEIMFTCPMDDKEE